jgi:hypothetical protein
MKPNDARPSLTELIDQLDKIREDLLRVQHSLENMEPEPEPAPLLDGEKGD